MPSVSLIRANQELPADAEQGVLEDVLVRDGLRIAPLPFGLLISRKQQGFVRLLDQFLLGEAADIPIPKNLLDLFKDLGRPPSERVEVLNRIARRAAKRRK